jgi:hypothetical protein
VDRPPDRHPPRLHRRRRLRPFLPSPLRLHARRLHDSTDDTGHVSGQGLRAPQPTGLLQKSSRLTPAPAMSSAADHSLSTVTDQWEGKWRWTS